MKRGGGWCGDNGDNGDKRADVDYRRFARLLSAYRAKWVRMRGVEPDMVRVANYLRCWGRENGDPVATLVAADPELLRRAWDYALSS